LLLLLLGVGGRRVCGTWGEVVVVVVIVCVRAAGWRGRRRRVESSIFCPRVRTLACVELLLLSIDNIRVQTLLGPTITLRSLGLSLAFLLRSVFEEVVCGAQ